MSYEVGLLSFGILLMLLGLIGKIKAKELEVGTSSVIVRVVTLIIGLFLIVLSFNPEIPKKFLAANFGAFGQANFSFSKAKPQNLLGQNHSKLARNKFL